MTYKLGCRKKFELETKTTHRREIANVQRKRIPNGESGY